MISTSNHLIRFSDCDPMGHLYNGRYLEYFMHAREDHLRENHNLDLYKYTAESGNSWVVIQNQIAYYKEAKLMEEVIITSRLLEMDDTMANVEMLMMDKNKKHIKSLLWVRFIHFSLKEKKVLPLSHEMKTFFQRLLLPLDETIFEKRSLKMRKSNIVDILG